MTIPIGGTDRGEEVTTEMGYPWLDEATRPRKQPAPTRQDVAIFGLFETEADILDRLRALEQQCEALAAQLRRLEGDGR